VVPFEDRVNVTFVDRVFAVTVVLPGKNVTPVGGVTQFKDNVEDPSVAAPSDVIVISYVTPEDAP
jgi:hypothetical protein